MRSSAFGGAYEPEQETECCFTPGEFLRQTAAIISICLGVALLIHVLLAAAAMQ
jgi:hypothetical protein